MAALHAAIEGMSAGPVLRVFISSVIEDFDAYRKAAADGVEAAGGEPVMVERFPSLAQSPRNACLDGVQTSDAYLVVVGDRGGWVTPSGALAVEEEFEEARKRSLPILAFLQEVSRDREGERLSRRVSDYVSGQFRRTFADPSDLQRKVADAVKGLITVVTLPRSDPDRALALLEPRERGPHEASVRLAVVPERVDELIPPDRLASQALVDEVYAIGHASNVRFFDYSCPKTRELLPNGTLVLSQRAHNSRTRLGASLELSERGEIAVEADVTGRDDSRNGGLSSMVIVESDLSSALTSEFGVAARLLDHLDPYDRLATVWVAATVLGAQHRYLVPAVPKGSASMRMGDNRAVPAENAPRRLSRESLRSSDGEVRRFMALFKRHLGERRNGR